MKRLGATRGQGLLAGAGELLSRAVRSPAPRARSLARDQYGDRLSAYLHQIIIVDGHDTPSPLPPSVIHNVEAARSFYPEARYILWNGKQLRDFIAKSFDNDVLLAFDHLSSYAYKCDLARYCLLYELGGLYIDLGVRIMAPWNVPGGYDVAAFRDLPFITSSWSTIQNGLLWARPGRREFALAIDYIVGNSRAKYYGSSPLHPTGPVLFGKAMLAAKVEGGPFAADAQYVGRCLAVTPDSKMLNVSYVSPDGTVVALRTKLAAGDLTELGVLQGNNYNQLWHSRRVYGERSWTWQLPEEPTTEPGRPREVCVVRPDPPCRLIEDDYEASLSFGSPPPVGTAVRLRSRVRGDRAVAADKIVDDDASRVVMPFAVRRQEDELELLIDMPGDQAAGSVTLTVACDQVRHWPARDDLIRVSHGTRTAAGIAIHRAAWGLVSFGPYTTLSEGRYRLDAVFTGVAPSWTSVRVQVCADFNKRKLGSTRISASRLADTGTVSVPFACETDMRNVEFRVFAQRGVQGLLTDFNLTRLG